MNLYLKPSIQMVQADAYMAVLRNSLQEIGTGVDRQYIHLARSGRGWTFTYGLRVVEFYQTSDDDNFWLRMTRGTKGSIETNFGDTEIVESVNITLNWLVHQEYSSDNPIELTERLAKEARKYAEE